MPLVNLEPYFLKKANNVDLHEPTLEVIIMSLDLDINY